MAKTLKNDPNRRMTNLVSSLGGGVAFPERDFPQLDRWRLGEWIAELRAGEASIRRLRKRLETLRDDVERKCGWCGGPVAGRADATYCSGNCRVKAHRAGARHAGKATTVG